MTDLEALAGLVTAGEIGRCSGEARIAAELREIAAELPCSQRQMHLEIAAQIVEQGQFMSPNDFGFAIQADELRARIAELEEALGRLERANNALCAKRSRKTYLHMVDADNASAELLALDEARSHARATLERAQAEGEGK